MPARSYEIRFRGYLPPEELLELEHLHASVEPAATVLWGCVPDQVALHGILARLPARPRAGTGGGAPPSRCHRVGPFGRGVNAMGGDHSSSLLPAHWGPCLRSMLSDLQVEERPRHHLLVLTDSDESSLLSLLARIAGDDREVQAMRGHRLTIG